MERRRIPDEVRKYMVKIGRKGGRLGGKSTSDAKREAARRNVAAVREKQRMDREGGRHAD